MLDLKYIDRVKWDDDLAKRLKRLRNKTSRSTLASKTTELGHRVAPQYIQQLEQPSLFSHRLKSKNLTVSLDVVQVLCEALGADLTDIFI
jgi:DNA polymerase III delta subunit